MYHSGRGVPQDHVKSYMWFNLAAVQVGRFEYDRQAVNNTILAILDKQQIAEGQRLTREWLNEHPQDDTKAIKWYHLADDLGEADAQYNLGLMYNNGGKGVPQDYAMAYMWFNLSAAQGNAKAKRTREILKER